MKYLVIHQNTTLGDTNISVIEAEDEAEICDKFMYPEYVTAIPLKGVLTAIGDTEGFPITSVSREDIKQASFPDVEFTDTEMKRITSLMADDYIEQMFWKSLEIIVQKVLDEREL